VKYDRHADTVGKTALELCKSDSFCRNKLSNPMEELNRLFSNYENQNTTCPMFFNRVNKILKKVSKTMLQTILFSFNAYIPYSLMNFIPQIILRVKRCNSDDQIKLKKLLDGFGVTKGEYRSTATLITLKIGLNEMLFNQTLPSLNDLVNESKRLLFSAGTSLFFRRLYEYFPMSKNDVYFNKFANTEKPILMLHGFFKFNYRKS
jgi:hypothetical protein